MSEEEHKELLIARKTMNARHSFSVYPRFDSVFKQKHSYNFDMMKTEIFMGREEGLYVDFLRWVAYGFIGFFTGLSAFLMA
mmetsp:Transcript_5754/g.9156  ORF Transcript_5754/g.9156 Transcript_5754/m.9156 type:complete len:81 (+) Transcript_5754:319-561(+)